MMTSNYSISKTHLLNFLKNCKVEGEVAQGIMERAKQMSIGAIYDAKNANERTTSEVISAIADSDFSYLSEEKLA